MDLFGEAFIAEKESNLGESVEKGDSLWSDIDIVFGIIEGLFLRLADIFEIDWTSQNGELSSDVLEYEVGAGFLLRKELLPDFDNF